VVQTSLADDARHVAGVADPTLSASGGSRGAARCVVGALVGAMAATYLVHRSFRSLRQIEGVAARMGLPRQSLCGFPVTEHAAFAQEIVGASTAGARLPLGTVFHMGEKTQEKASLMRDSLAMHTFITGATGAGKSNAVYHLLEQLPDEEIPFLVIEPAKGEYKNVFGSNGIAVYGTNPKRGAILRLNPFRFPKEIHVLEHLDRLVEIFNVCWPM